MRQEREVGQRQTLVSMNLERCPPTILLLEAERQRERERGRTKPGAEFTAMTSFT